jgi:hypothetical protein
MPVLDRMLLLLLLLRLKMVMRRRHGRGRRVVMRLIPAGHLSLVIFFFSGEIKR